jgi:hypothetical protein
MSAAALDEPGFEYALLTAAADRSVPEHCFRSDAVPLLPASLGTGIGLDLTAADAPCAGFDAAGSG